MSRWLRVRLVLDRIAAALLVIAAAPVIALLALVVRRDDNGPGLITVERVGTHGRTFRMWKVRTMRVSSPDGTAGGPPLTGAEDERITSIGRRLRSYHVDELPQLWNVLRGEMLLLGPRPEAPSFVHVDDPRWDDVLSVPPGIAGPTQLVVGEWERASLAQGIDYYEREILPVKLAADAWYVRSASPWLDLFVVASLFGRFRDHGGWRLRRLVAARVAEVDEALRGTRSGSR